MKAQKTKMKLEFNKHAISELNDADMNAINGATISIIIETIIRTKTYGTWIDHGPL